MTIATTFLCDVCPAEAIGTAGPETVPTGWGLFTLVRRGEVADVALNVGRHWCPSCLEGQAKAMGLAV